MVGGWWLVVLGRGRAFRAGGSRPWEGLQARRFPIRRRVARTDQKANWAALCPSFRRKPESSLTSLLLLPLLS
ncbi:hypothetical protein GLE_0557 [Lysobacter enzymogenes]|uniref:Uncharacterized protein n=1 Tax=Lysobacter enzymogenes TaxID=69 RepID=A0A0S2DBK7_LYSEN|nr:hypothetical protein GLE_0557 [Lysobacter enzymogenes]